MELDLNSLTSVRNFAKAFSDKYKQLNFLIENAGIMIPPFQKTEDGFESQMGVNHFSHFLFLPSTLTQPARVPTLLLKAPSHANQPDFP